MTYHFDGEHFEPETVYAICGEEGLCRQAYRDGGGVWTWAFGLTNKCGHRVTRYIGKPQTIEHCLAIYLWALRNYAEDVAAAFGGHPLTLAQFTAALSFHWNTGAIRSASWVRYFQKGELEAAHASFLSWDIPSSIIERREREADLFFNEAWTHDGLCREWTRLTNSSHIDWRYGRTISLKPHIAGLSAINHERKMCQ